MGRWGINRTVAQVHALLLPRSLNAEQVAATLGVARSNVSNSLRELQGWKIVRVTHVLGDRRDYFESLKDVWELFRHRRRAEEARGRSHARDAARSRGGREEGRRADEDTRERLADLLQFFELMTGWVDQTRKLPTPSPAPGEGRRPDCEDASIVTRRWARAG